MNRREMLKLGAALAVAPSVPVAAADPWDFLRYAAIRPGVYRMLYVVGGAKAIHQRWDEATGMWEDV